MAVIRILAALLVVAALLWAVWMMVRPYLQSPRRRLKRQFRRMRSLILEAVDASERQRARRLLEDCEAHLDRLLRARERLEVIADMVETASEMTGRRPDADPEQMRARVHDNLMDLLEKMGTVAAEVDYDWRRSVEQLEDFTDELEERREIFARLERLEEFETVDVPREDG